MHVLDLLYIRARDRPHRTVVSAASWPPLILWGRISDNSVKYSTCIDMFMKLNEETRRGAHTSSIFNNALIDCDNYQTHVRFCLSK